jgi:hypothetical protein
LPLHHPRFETAFDVPSHGRIGLKFAEECLVVDMVEGSFDVRVEHIFRLVADAYEDRSDCIMAGPTWPEPITVWLEFGLPFWF